MKTTFSQGPDLDKPFLAINGVGPETTAELYGDAEMTGDRNGVGRRYAVAMAQI